MLTTNEPNNRILKVNTFLVGALQSYKGTKILLSFREGLCEAHPLELLDMVTIGSSTKLQCMDH